VTKRKRNGRPGSVQAEVVFATLRAGEAASASYPERQNATGRRRDARRGRKTYRFSGDWGAHEAMTVFTMYS
jgi:hypothetical protein